MTLHRPSGRWQLGLGLSLVTAVLWGGLPLALKIILQKLDAATLTWFRFLTAGALMVALLGARGGLRPLRRLDRTSVALLVVAVLGLASNYYFFQRGLGLVGAGTAQVLIQFSPVLFLLGSIAIFGERLVRLQLLGLVILAAGLVLFFRDSLSGEAPPHGDAYGTGLVFVVIAGITWAGFALAQKQLLVRLPSTALMTVVYLGSALALTPLVRFDGLLALDGMRFALVVYAALNTVVAYGAFAEALAHWEGARVSAVLAIVPILTMAIGEAAARWWPGVVEPEPLSAASWIGALLVVAGSILTSLAKGRASRAN